MSQMKKFIIRRADEAVWGKTPGKMPGHSFNYGGNNSLFTKKETTAALKRLKKFAPGMKLQAEEVSA